MTDAAERADALDRIDDALRENPALNQRILEAIPGGVVVVSRQGAILRANAEAVRFLGLSFDELARRYVSAWGPETVREDGSPCPVEEYPVARCLATGKPQPAVTIGVRQRSGELRWGVFTAVPVPDPERPEASSGVIVTFLDVTESKRAELALRASQERLRLLLEHAPDFVFTVDHEGRILYINRAGPGRSPSDVVGRPSVQFAAPDYRERWLAFQARALAGEEAAQLETQSDQGRWFHTRAAPIRDETGRVTEVMCISTDVTEGKRAEHERLRLEGRVQESVRLESLGILAGGMAHDFNNLLVGILGGIDLALRRIPEDAPSRPLLLTARQASLRASELTNQLLAYSGKGRLEIQPIDLNAVVREVTQLLAATFEGRATLELDLLEPLPSIQADQSQLGRVVMNLVTNAIEAHEAGRGAVQVRTRVVGQEQARQLATHGFEELTHASYVLLEVEDEGAGMDERIRARIFDPFFTTKLHGRGLGLPAVLGIVRGHGGGIGVRSTPGSGTSFQVLLPASGQPYAPRSEPSTPPAASPRIAPGAGGCVLVVDDEPHVRSIARTALEEQGFRVLVASDGRQAIELLRAHEREVDLAILDLLMPGLDGEETLRALRSIRPDLRVIVSSGYGEETARRGGLACAPRVVFLGKPYSVQTLIEAVTRTLAK